MSEERKDGGDISSGFGDSKVSGPVSDEKAEQMLHEDADQGTDDEVYAVGRDGTAYTEADVATNEQDIARGNLADGPDGGGGGAG